MTRETRHYTVLGLIGRGGQGNVYHARLEDTGGFRKDVAIKLLREGLSEESMQRFRDEARILGLVRDRSIISVDPPIRLAGRWALVMELAEGMSTHMLMARGGPLPVTVALEIVGEIARVLDKMYRAVGPDGRPLHLVHRDIKPGNIQITAEGEVKLLDFGVARADFDERETQTVQHIGGTFGFIAPERLHGDNGPSCDVYSLGVTLRVLLTGEKPSTMGPATLAAVSPDLFHALALAEVMRHEDLAQRPTARQVVDLAKGLRASLKGPTLREWAEEAIPKLKFRLEDPLVGSVLTESFELEPPPPLKTDGSIEMASAQSGDPSLRLLPAGRTPAQILYRRALAVAVVALMVLLLAVSTLGVIGGKWLASLQEEPVAAQAQPRDVSELAKASEVQPAPEPQPASEDQPAEAPDPPLPEPASATPEPAPAPTAPAPPPGSRALAPRVATVDIFSELPAAIFLDGVKIGVTPLRQRAIPVGTHQIRLVGSERSVEATVLVGGRRGATRFEWDGGPALSAR